MTATGAVHLATGLAIRDGRVLLVASRYPNHPQPLWNLPGGRQQPGELLEETVVREVFEETGLVARVGDLAYVSESYDGDAHFFNATFSVTLRQAQRDEANPSFDSARCARSAQDDNSVARSAQDDNSVARSAQPFDSAQDDNDDKIEHPSIPNDNFKRTFDDNEHVVGVEWVGIEQLAERIVVGVVREPLLAYLRNELPRRYAGYHEAGITIEWPADSR